MSNHGALGQLLSHRSIGLASSLFACVAGGERSLQDNRKQGLQPSASTGVLAVARVRERTMRALLCVVATAAALSGSARPPPRPPRGKSKGRSRAQRRGNVNVPSSVPEDESIDAREARLAAKFAAWAKEPPRDEEVVVEKEETPAKSNKDQHKNHSRTRNDLIRRLSFMVSIAKRISCGTSFISERA